MSIRPEFSRAIFGGRKTVELRRSVSGSLRAGDLVFVYSTSPDQAILGFFVIAGVKSMALRRLWAAYRKHACIDREAFFNYFDGTDRGFAIELSDVFGFREPLRLAEIREEFEFSVPQSYRYLRAHELEYLAKHEGPGRHKRRHLLGGPSRH